MASNILLRWTILTAVLYLVGAFWAADPNIAVWESPARYTLGSIWGILCLAILTIPEMK